MIVSLDCEGGARTETAVAESGEYSPDEIARGLLSSLARVTRARVWEDGRSFLEPPSADAIRDPEPPGAALPTAYSTDPHVMARVADRLRALVP
jgi:hypothetical protein